MMASAVMVPGGQGQRGGGPTGAQPPRQDFPEMRRLNEEIEAMQRSLDASQMIRKEHDWAVGRFRHEVNALVDRRRRELDDFFSHAVTSKLGIEQAGLHSVGIGVSKGGELGNPPLSAPPPVTAGSSGGDGTGAATGEELLLAQERQKSAALLQRVQLLESENAEQKEHLRRHQERWQRVRDEYAKKKQNENG